MSEAGPTLRELFETASALDGDTRMRYLESHCDRALRTRLERMLAADASAASVLPKLTAANAAAAFAESSAAWRAPIGTRIGPFELSEMLGEGGSSTVFRAWRSVDGVRQDVALKLLRRGIVSCDAQRQYRRELQALAQLRHAGIARLIEGGITETGAAYIALELVDGVPITEYARMHRLDVPARLLLFLEACRAVDAAHRALIVHRDLKPSNVLVDADGKVKLLDFGVAKLLAADEDTQTNLRAFTPAYASPEQRSGGAITTATDVYGLGLMLGELLTGERFGADPARTPSSRISDESDATLLPAPPAMTRRILRGDLDNIVMKALDPDPALRYASAGRVADDIERALDGRPVSAHPPSRWYRTRKFVGRHRGGVAASVAVALAILASLGIALWQAGIARREATEAHAQAERAEATRAFMADAFQQLDPDENGGRPFTAEDLLDRSERQLERRQRTGIVDADAAALLAQLSVQVGDLDRAVKLATRALPVGEDPATPADVRARIMMQVALVETEQESFETAMRHATAGLGLLDPKMPGEGLLHAKASTVISHALIARGDWSGAVQFLRSAIPVDAAALGEDAEPLGEEWLTYGRALSRLHDFTPARVAFEHGLASARLAYGGESIRMAHALNEQSDMLGDAGDFDGAEQALREALRIRTRVVGPNNRDTLTVEHNLLAVIEMAGRVGEALPQRLALIERAQTVSQLHPRDIGFFRGRAGGDFRDLGRFDEAVAMFEAAIAILGPDASYTTRAWLAYAGTLVLMGRFDDADAAIAQLHRIMERNPKSTQFERAAASIPAGTLQRLRGHPEDAVATLRAASAVYEGADAFDRDRPIAQAQLAEAELDANELAAARSDAEHALENVRRTLPKAHPLLGSPLFALARVALAENRAADATALLLEARSVRADLPPGDPRRLEIGVALVDALTREGRVDEANDERAALAAPLAAAKSPYAAILRARLAAANPAH
jgi:serine/threonine-protein kinase